MEWGLPTVMAKELPYQEQYWERYTFPILGKVQYNFKKKVIVITKEQS